jgi:hypothetical protein
MTRINVGIDPRELPNKLLLAEHRELKRIPNTISSGKAIIHNIPTSFTLNIGHVKFFYNKVKYLQRRYQALYEECLNRDFLVTNYSSAFDDVPNYLMNDYIPKERDRELLIERIESKDFYLLKAERDISL